MLTCCLDAVAHGFGSACGTCVRTLKAPWKPRQSLMVLGLCAEPASAPCKPRGNHGSRSWFWVCVRNLRPHLVSPVETTAVAHGGNPQDRAAFPRPRCLPKTALPSQDRAASPRPRCLPKTALHRLFKS